jgi:anhydro-N-acetylmuramic acid kinase
MLIDAVVSQLSDGRFAYDHGGRWAARGRVSVSLLERMLAHPFLKKLPPKTTGREEFGAPMASDFLTSAQKLRLRPEDAVATATAFTAISIAYAYRRFVAPRLESRKVWARPQIVLGGGGAHNRTLRSMLRVWLGAFGAQVLTHEDFGIDNSAKEALAFALLAHEALAGRPGNLPRATGSLHEVVLGKIVRAQAN